MLRALAPWPREVHKTELLDQPGTPLEELAESLRVIARLNRMGALSGLLASVAPFLGSAARRDGPGATARPLRILDLGTGAADIPAAVARLARARGRAVRVIGVDLRPDVLACAAPVARELPEVRLVAADALRLPVRTGGVDLALCSLTLHHLPPDAVVALLRAMSEVTRLGFVVSDLRRSRLAWAIVWGATHLISRNRLVRHDGPLSVRRAYTRGELASLAARAGLHRIRWRRGAFFRLIGVYTHDVAR